MNEPLLSVQDRTSYSGLNRCVLYEGLQKVSLDETVLLWDRNKHLYGEIIIGFCGMGMFNPLGQTWLTALTLKPEEQVIIAWNGDRETQAQVARTKTVERGLIRKHDEQVTTGKFDTVKDTNSGFLVLTSQRLVWFERHGVLSKQVRPTVTFDLLGIQGIAKGGKLATWVSIADNEQEHLFHFGRMSDEDFLQKFKGPIVQAAYRLKQKLEQVRTTNAVVDAQAVAKAQVEMISCKYCEAKNASDKERCWRCGASL